jgi:hypothetical protein
MPSLYDTIDLCGLHLPNRVFMAPLTRNRALPDGTPGPWAEAYYRQQRTVLRRRPPRAPSRAMKSSKPSMTMAGRPRMPGPQASTASKSMRPTAT